MHAAECESGRGAMCSARINASSSLFSLLINLLARSGILLQLFSLSFEVALFATFANRASRSTASSLHSFAITGGWVILGCCQRVLQARRRLNWGLRKTTSGGRIVNFRLRLRNAFSFLFLLLANERSDHADFVIVMLVKVETEFLCWPQLHQVVVEGLLGDLDFLGSLLKGHLDEGTIFIVEASVEEAPQAHFLDDLLDGALLDSGLCLIVIVFLLVDCTLLLNIKSKSHHVWWSKVMGNRVIVANNLGFFNQRRSKKDNGRLSESILKGCLAKYLLF